QGNGAIDAVIFDWAGTLIDFGSRAPVIAFVEAFQRFQVAVTVDEAREPMGLPKRDHIKAMLTMPRVTALWCEAQGKKDVTEADIDRVYETYLPLNQTIAADHATLIPGALDALSAIEAQGIKIGTTTGYVRSIMEGVLPKVAAQGFEPMSVVCADDVPYGRPTAMAMLASFVALGVSVPGRTVKVDDTVPGIEEGVAAGSWTIGLSLSGNEVGMTADEIAAHTTDRNDLDARKKAAAAKLTDAGAHYVVDTVADILPVLDQISGRIKAGEIPVPGTFETHQV
ncbi:MAG: phosphonoacetaldehyde hydrolase, partial [Pseudomonadota bacterium]